MENTVFESIEDVDDVSTLDEYRVALTAGLTPEAALAAVAFYSRDNARTPFQWDAGENAGFSTGTPWMRVNPNYTRVNLADQRGREGSVYEFYRSLIALRRSPDYAETVVYGETEPFLPEQKNLMAYFRRGDKTLLAAGNFQAEPQDMPLPGTVKTVLINNLTAFGAADGLARLEPWQFIVLEME